MEAFDVCLDGEIAKAKARLTQTRPIILASGSPRRRWLLSKLGLEFDVVVPDVSEPEPDGSFDPETYVQHTAFLKAQAVARRFPKDFRPILAADTMTVAQGHVLGKPVDRNDARRILTLLQGHQHQTLTGLCLSVPNSGFSLLTVECTQVFMRTLSAVELEEYLDSNDWQGKAGAYGIQEKNDPFVESIDGSMTNVIGLPVVRVVEMLNRAAADCSRMETV